MTAVEVKQCHPCHQGLGEMGGALRASSLPVSTGHILSKYCRVLSARNRERQGFPASELTPVQGETGEGDHQETETLQPRPDDAERGYIWVWRIRIQTSDS